MKKPEDFDSMNRRDFLKIGAAGAAVASIGLSGVGSLLHAQASTEPVYRTLGRTGLKVTTLSFGAMLTPESEVIRAGLDMGINYVDTARRYLGGRSEGIVGRAVKGVRDKLYIATKTKPDSNTAEAIIKDVETSLGELGTDHIDVIQLHNLDEPKRAFIPEVREAYLKLRKEGKVRFFGVTTHTNQAEVIDALVNDPDKFFDTVLVGYNMKTDPSVKQAIARAKEAGLGIVAMKIQAAVRGVPEAPSISPEQASAAFKWVLQDTNVSNVIAGMRTLEQIRNMFPVMGAKMTAADERRVERYSAAIDKEFCRLCAKCEPTCPNGVRISIVNRALMYAEAYREPALARETLREVPSARLCATCTDCVARCVNGISIAEKMRRARNLYA